VAKRILIAALLTPVLFLTGLGAATAKDAITRLRLCGASGCVTVRDMTTLQILMTYIGSWAAEPPAAAPYLTFAPIPTRQWPSSYPRYVYVPSANVIRIHYPSSASRWSGIGNAAPLLHQLTAGIRAYPTPSAWRVVTVTPRATADIAGAQADFATAFQTTRDVQHRRRSRAGIWACTLMTHLLCRLPESPTERAHRIGKPCSGNAKKP
jgi:hypothetical protein